MHPYNAELTFEVLRTYKGFEDISDEEAKKILQQLKEFCLLIIESNSRRIITQFQKQ